MFRKFGSRLQRRDWDYFSANLGPTWGGGGADKREQLKFRAFLQEVSQQRRFCSVGAQQHHIGRFLPLIGRWSMLPRRARVRVSDRWTALKYPFAASEVVDGPGERLRSRENCWVRR